MKWISSQPATLYYAWQVEVYIKNFIENGINPKDIQVIFVYDSEIPNEIKLIAEKYEDVGFYLYPDTRPNTDYIPSIYFNGVKQHFKEFPELENEVVMFHDSDTILLRPWSSKHLLNDDIWYFSNTNSYINYDYIISKGQDVYRGMLDIVGIGESIPKLNNSNSGGAQHLIKNTNWEFWDKVESDSIALYKFFCQIEPYYVKRHESDYPIQKWTAGMWSLLWNSWKFGNEVRISHDMSFCWATDNINAMEGKQFLHNAGVTTDRQDLFFKGKWIDSIPYQKNLQINPNYCSSEYYKWILNVEVDSPLTNL
jgi:hypothetical protein